VDDDPILILLLLPFPEWVGSANRYWSTLA